MPSIIISKVEKSKKDTEGRVCIGFSVFVYMPTVLRIGAECVAGVGDVCTSIESRIYRV
jgi:hypothetical protein